MKNQHRKLLPHHFMCIHGQKQHSNKVNNTHHWWSCWCVCLVVIVRWFYVYIWRFVRLFFQFFHAKPKSLSFSPGFYCCFFCFSSFHLFFGISVEKNTHKTRTNNKVPIDIYLFFLSVYNNFVHKSRELMVKHRPKSIDVEQMHNFSLLISRLELICTKCLPHDDAFMARALWISEKERERERPRDDGKSVFNGDSEMAE